MKNIIKRTLTSLFLGTAFWVLFLYLPPFYFSFILAALLVQIIIFEWTRLFKKTNPIFWLLMPLYPILPFSILIWMNNNPTYHPLLFPLFILVASHDTGSYIVGSLIGKTKICPVSPGKTWEGFFGGYVFACIGLYLLLWEQKNIQPWWFIIGFSFIVCALALIGDFFESWLKRRAGVKDSGSVLPGHGGFLDRFDGILFAVFFFYMLKDYLVLIFD